MRAGIVVVVWLALAAPASASLRVTGGTPGRLGVCPDRLHTVFSAPAGARVSAQRRGRGRGRLRIAKCVNGRFKTMRTVRRRTARLATGADAVGDYRIRLTGRHPRTRYVRIGVGEIVDVPVSFPVVNQNRTGISCPAPGPDGKPYVVKGTLAAPRALLTRDGPSVALYYHGLSYASFFFRFQDVPGYDYALEQARDGHASVVVDRLGYGDSEGPDGNAVCYGSQADIADQVIGALKSGAAGPRFSRVALVGHSAGGFISEIAQYSFASADALAIADYADQGSSNMTANNLTAASAKCASAPDRSRGDTGVPNYAFFGETDDDYKAGHIHDADPAVVGAVLKRRTRDPCGDLNSIPASLAADMMGAGSISVPVLVICGADDALFPPPACQQQEERFTGSADTSYVELEDTGHAVTLGRTHEAFRAAMDAWLDGHGF